MQVEDVDRAPAQRRVDHVADGAHLDDRPLLVHAGGLAHSQELIDALQLGSGPQLGVRLKALEGGLAGLAMNVAMVAFGHPGFPAGIELGEGQQLFALTHLALELLLEGQCPASTSSPFL
jgi:hypothetical protein